VCCTKLPNYGLCEGSLTPGRGRVFYHYHHCTCTGCWPTKQGAGALSPGGNDRNVKLTHLSPMPRSVLLGDLPPRLRGMVVVVYFQ
jgi:hypothetical protein